MENEMIYILYSADYELFLGKNHLLEKEILIDTTNKLTEVCNEVNIPMNFFIDALCIIKYAEIGRDEFVNMVKNQLINVYQNGHDVQAHIHPHWINAKYISGQWQFALNDFLLGNSFDNLDDIYNHSLAILSQVKDYLTNIIQTVDPEYKCIACRLGGYGIQPNEKQVIKALYEAGFTIDSSIVPGKKYISNVNKIDFTNVPDLSNYFINSKHGIDKPSSSGIFEIPIAAVNEQKKTDIIVRFSGKFIRALHRNRYKPTINGVEIQRINRIQLTALQRIFTIIIKQMSQIRKLWFQLELSYDPKHMFNITKYYLNKYENQKADVFFSFICHPKSISNMHLQSLRKFHSLLKNYYKDNIHAITFQQANALLKNTTLK
jgi:hypothetical protein